MRLLLIRHGETVDNVAGNLAGVTDSALTNHGVLQAERLGKHLASKYAPFSAILCSDLTRAKQTAQAILDATAAKRPSPPADGAPPTATSLIVLGLLREQDFGSLEGKPWASNRAPGSDIPDASTAGFVASETKASMDIRANAFVDDYIMPLLVVEPDSTVPVVSHGLLLSRLWKRLLARSLPEDIHLADNIMVGPRGLEHIGAWSNTGFLELDLSTKERSTGSERQGNSSDSKVGRSGSKLMVEANDTTQNALQELLAPEDGDEEPEPSRAAISPLPRSASYATDEPVYLKISVRAINSLTHLTSLKRTRGGIGSSAHDVGQGKIDSFFKKQRNNNTL